MQLHQRGDIFGKLDNRTMSAFSLCSIRPSVDDQIRTKQVAHATTGSTRLLVALRTLRRWYRGEQNHGRRKCLPYKMGAQHLSKTTSGLTAVRVYSL